VLGSTIVLRASLRGPGQENRRYLIHEWTYGKYERVIELPMDVDADHANASHSNGILALTLPKARGSRAVRVPLNKVNSSGGVQEGHSGHHTAREGLPDSSGG
jgi:HSP20 family molecular chaperone IbpA